jgi:hypothetical protein
VDDIRRAKQLASKRIDYVDVRTSGGVWGLERGYCMMIGGPDQAVQRLDPVFQELAPGVDDIARTPGMEIIGGTAEQGYLHCGPSGAGHFVKMVHNGIEYGVMAAYAEGLGVLRGAGIGKRPHEIDAETTPLRDPEHYQYDLNLRDIAEVWRRGSALPPVIGWAAVRGSVGAEAGALFAVLFQWQVPHFLAIAWIYREDYGRAGLCMLPSVDPEGTATGRQMIVYCLALLAASLMPVVVHGAGPVYLAGALLLGIGFLAYAIGFSLRRSTARGRGVLRASLIYLPALLTLWLLDGIPQG